MRLLLADAVKKPLNGEDGASEDVDPEEGHEDNPNHFTMGHAKDSPRERPRYDALNPTQRVLV